METVEVTISVDHKNTLSNEELLFMSVLTCGQLISHIHNKLWIDSPLECAELHKYRVLKVWYFNWIKEHCAQNVDETKMEIVSITGDFVSKTSLNRYNCLIKMDETFLKGMSCAHLMQCVTRIVNYTLRKFMVVARQEDRAFFLTAMNRLRNQGNHVNRELYKKYPSVFELCRYRRLVVQLLRQRPNDTNNC